MPRSKNWKRKTAAKKALARQNDDCSTSAFDSVSVDCIETADEILDNYSEYAELDCDTCIPNQDGSSSSIPNQDGSSSSPRIVNGSYHQGNSFLFPLNGGKQCVANSLMSLIYSKVKSLNEWTGSDMDAVLMHGDELYGHVQRSSTMSDGYLLVTELPEHLDVFNTTFTLVQDGPKAGYIWPAQEMIQFGDLVTLETALEEALENRASCFINFCQAVFMVIHNQGTYFVFDSHSRNRQGVLSVDGTSILIQYHSVHAVYEHCTRLALSMGGNPNTLFEVTPVSVSCENAIETPRTCRSQKPAKLPFVKRKSVTKSQNNGKVKKRILENLKPSSVNTSFEDTELMPSSVDTSNESDIETNYPEFQSLKLTTPFKKKSERASRTVNRQGMKSKRNHDKPQGADKVTSTRSSRAAQKYMNNEEYRQNLKRKTATLYAESESYKKKLRTASENSEFRDSVKSASTAKYRHNPQFRDSVKSASIDRYRTDPQFRDCVKSASIDKYRTDPQFRDSVKSASIDRYNSHSQFRDAVKSAVNTKYRDNAIFRQAVLSAKNVNYRNNPSFREKLKNRSRVRRERNKVFSKKMSHVLKRFKNMITEGPEYVCSVCNRRLFKNQVLKCSKTNYFNSLELAELCITDNFVHKCNEVCSKHCMISKGPTGKSWICHTCHRKLKSGKKPAEAAINNLKLQDIPRELQQLNPLEQHMVSLNIPFMKVMALPKGGQNGVHGPTVCVPSNLNKTMSVLPRCETSDQMIRVKLKRKLSFKGHYEYQYVNTEHIKEALSYLKTNNILYKDITFNNDWVNPNDVTEVREDDCEMDENVAPQAEENVTSQCDVNNSEGSSSQSDDNASHGNDENGLLLDTCLQPVDIGQHFLDSNFENILNIAPCEGSTPTGISSDQTNEAKCFPVLFPQGAPSFHDAREERITLGRYLNSRLLNADSRFANNTDYIFYAQYLSELEQVKSNVSVSIRKGLTSGKGKTISSKHLTDRDSLNEILKNDDGYKFLKPIRGTPPFWQAVQKDIFAMIRQLGIPTWFCSFSSAEFRWPEIINSILRETGDSRRFEDLDWNSKCGILRKNPVTAARMFNERFHHFLHDVIMSQAAPIGKVVDYFYRVEFQQRGSPHTHCLFWIEKAPKISIDDDDVVVDFVDKYITCELPDVHNDVELHDIVDCVQKHSKNHSKTCRKTGKVCRFNFPRPPSCQTFVCHTSKDETKTVEDLPKDDDGNPDLNLLRSNKMSPKTAEIILNGIWKEINDESINYDSTDDLFEALGITQEIFQEACSALGKKTSVVLQRRPCDTWINQYNPDLLRCWDANMDIQYVVDAYSCVVYIISYISKAEREMGLLLSQTEKEARNENVDAKQSLKKIGHAYLTHREVSAQEAVFRVCNLHLKQGSRLVQFIPVGTETIRMSLPIETLKQKCRSAQFNEDDMWATSIIDRYIKRPETPEMSQLCLAKFCSDYRIVSSSEISRVDNSKRRTPLLELKDNLGFMQKRTNSPPAVVRYPRFSKLKNSEKFYQSILQLFLPYRHSDHLKPPNFETFEDFYVHGSVKICNVLKSVKAIVDENRNNFEKDAEELEVAETVLGNAGPLDDAWAQICPETELERHESEEVVHTYHDIEDFEENIPELTTNGNSLFTTDTVKSSLSKIEAEKILASLNREQSDIFFKIRYWALQKRNGYETKPFHLCIHGPGGTGKSLLIKAVTYECNRLLAKTRENPDGISVLLTAPTGVAAFNINAQTIHSAFSIGIDAYLPYIPLGEEKINTLRSKYQDLQLLIIDEISMVDHKLLTYIHGRLRQIKQSPEEIPFGNISVLAVGDFYQLPPVKGKPLLAEKIGIDYFNDFFVKAELTQIMRQKNKFFSEILNRLRVRSRKAALEPNDITTLQSRETGEDSDCIHIFAKNVNVDEYNLKKLRETCADVKTIPAVDTLKQKQTGVKVKQSQCGSFVLPTTLTVGVGARVMLTRNIDTPDGLVNGVFGSITHFKVKPNEETVETIFISFDDLKVGVNLRRTTTFPNNVSTSSTPILRQEESAKNGSGMRSQFPLKLAWACTVHKTQGLTVDKAVVSFNGIQTSGQAYVALSRVRTLEGLTIQHFQEDKIFCNDLVTDALTKMKHFVCGSLSHEDVHKLKVVLHNIQGLETHFNCLKGDERFVMADLICVTETWISDPMVRKEYLQSFTFYHQNRESSYNTSNSMFSNLRTQAQGGVGIFVKNGMTVQTVEHSCNIEHVCLHLPEEDVVVVVIYRPSTYKLPIFRENLSTLISSLLRMFHCGMIVMGDFNENLKTSSSVQDLLAMCGFTLHVSEATTEDDTIIDHVYIRNIENISVNMIPTYYSFHEALEIRM